MPDDLTPVTGAYYAESLPGWVTLDVTPLVDHNVHDLLEILAEDDVFESFLHVSSTEPPACGHDGHAPDRLAFEQLKDYLVDRLATKVRMTVPQAMRVGSRVLELSAALVGEAAASEEIVTRPDCPLGGRHSPGVPCDSRCDEQATALATLRSIAARQNGRTA